MIIHQIIFNIKLIFLFVEHVQDQLTWLKELSAILYGEQIINYGRYGGKTSFGQDNPTLVKKGSSPGMGVKPVELHGPLADNSTPVLKGSIPPGVESKTQWLGN